MNKKLEFSVRLDRGAKMPTRAHDSDAGFDLYAPMDLESGVVRPDGDITIDTGVHILMPKGWCGLIVSKSGLNVRDGLTSTGLVDAGYSGSIVVKLYNHTKQTHIIERGQKISQIMILPVPSVELKLVEFFSEGTDRGASGFGSSGKF